MITESVLKQFFRTPLFTKSVGNRRMRAVTYDLMRESPTFHFGLKMFHATRTDSFREELLELLYETIKLHFIAQAHQYFYATPYEEDGETHHEGPKRVVITQTITFMDPEEFDAQEDPKIVITGNDETNEIVFAYDPGKYDSKVIFEPKDLHFLTPSPIEAANRLQPRPRPEEAV